MKAYVYIVLACLSLAVQAQSSLLETLARLEQEHDVRFSFDADLVAAISDNIQFEEEDLDGFMVRMQTEFPFKIEAVGDGYFTISVREATYRLAAIDSLDNTGIPVELGMYVIVNNKTLPIKATDGFWTFSYKPDLADKIELYAPGYDRRTLDPKDLFTGLQLSYPLAISTIHLSAVTVEDYLTKGINLEPSSQSIKIKVSDLPLLPGETDGDIFASIAALPGISTPDSRAGNLFIRGSETDQTLILYDNIPIYHRGHYYGTISPYNPKLIESVQVYRSGFNASMGDRVGGAVIIESGEENLQKGVYGMGANTLYGMGYAKVRLTGNSSFAVGGRRSWGENFNTPKLDAISESVFDATAADDADGNYMGNGAVLFEDYHANGVIQINEKNHLHLSGIYTNTRATVDPIFQPNNATASEQSGFTNAGFSLKWNADISAKWQSSTVGVVSAYDFLNYTDPDAPDRPTLRSENVIRDLGFQQSFKKSIPRGAYTMGLDAKRQSVDIDYLNVNQQMELVSISEQQQATTLSPFFNIDLNLNKWFVQYGTRVTYYSELEDVKLAPRILVNYEPRQGVILKSSYGFYNQYLSQVRNLEFGSGGFDNELWRLASKDKTRIMEGEQGMIGFTTYADKWLIDFEAFGKQVDNITLYEDRRLSVPGDYFTMNQMTYGLDLLHKRNFSEATSMWVGYSYHDSRVALDTTNQATYLSKFVQPHTLYVGTSVVKERWKLSAGWRYASGLNAQSLDVVYAEILFHRNNANLPPGQDPPPSPFEDRNPRYEAVHFLDISTTYLIPKTEVRRWNASIGLSLINVLDQKNLTDQVFRGRQGFIDRYSVGFAPNLMVIFEW